MLTMEFIIIILQGRENLQIKTVFFKQESKKAKVIGVMYENLTLHQYCFEVMITELKRYFE